MPRHLAPRGASSTRSCAPPRCARSIAALVALAGLTLLGALAPARAAYYIPPYPYRAKEFDIVRLGDTFHVFYIRQDLLKPFDSTTVDLGHATTGNFVTWQEQDPILKIRPGSWDNLHIWAPSIVNKDGIWYLFYTGVTYQPGVYSYHQRIGLAWSTDLYHWSRLDQPIFECADCPWTYCDPNNALGGDFRDPSVMPDPTRPGDWLMYYAARRPTDPGQMLIGVARTTGPFDTWSDLGPMWNTGIVHTGSEVVESPELFQHGSLWYLFYTTDAAQPIAFQTASSPLADSSRWSPQMRLHTEVPGSDPWFGIELYPSYGHDYLLAADSEIRGLTILEVVWDTPPHFHTVEPAVTPAPVGVGDVTPGTLSLERIPEVRGDRARLRITLPSAMPVALEVLDVQGRRIRRLLDGALPAGITELSWDGASDADRAAPAGVYVARLRTASGDRAARIVLVR